ncbi:MAG: hypothetical protein R8G34_02570 [Paracoccaceae bacterium]|nr:hypothetical protein [Paracoccaceae bacterium]
MLLIIAAKRCLGLKSVANGIAFWVINFADHVSASDDAVDELDLRLDNGPVGKPCDLWLQPGAVCRLAGVDLKRAKAFCWGRQSTISFRFVNVVCTHGVDP